MTWHDMTGQAQHWCLLLPSVLTLWHTRNAAQPYAAPDPPPCTARFVACFRPVGFRSIFSTSTVCTSRTRPCTCVWQIHRNFDAASSRFTVLLNLGWTFWSPKIGERNVVLRVTYVLALTLKLLLHLFPSSVVAVLTYGCCNEPTSEVYAR